jgi:acyl carrier protein
VNPLPGAAQPPGTADPTDLLPRPIAHRCAAVLADTGADVADARFVTADLGAGPELAVLVRSAGLGAAADLRDELLAAVGSDARCPVVIVAEDAMIPDALTSQPGAAILVAPDQPGVYRWVPPATQTEVALAAVLAEGLGRTQVSMSDNFLDLGGDSLTAIGVAFGFRARTGTRLPLDALFEAATIADLVRLAEDGAS